MQVNMYNEGDVILREGDAAESIYFLHHGSVEVLVGQSQEVATTIDGGDVFGVMAYFSMGHKCNYTVKATDFCDCRTLHHRLFAKVLKKFPKEQGRFEKIASQRADAVSKLHAAHAARKSSIESSKEWSGPSSRRNTIGSSSSEAEGQAARKKSMRSTVPLVSYLARSSLRSSRRNTDPDPALQVDVTPSKASSSKPDANETTASNRRNFFRTASDADEISYPQSIELDTSSATASSESIEEDAMNGQAQDQHQDDESCRPPQSASSASQMSMSTNPWNEIRPLPPGLSPRRRIPPRSYKLATMAHYTLPIMLPKPATPRLPPQVCRTMTQPHRGRYVALSPEEVALKLHHEQSALERVYIEESERFFDGLNDISHDMSSTSFLRGLTARPHPSRWEMYYPKTLPARPRPDTWESSSRQLGYTPAVHAHTSLNTDLTASSKSIGYTPAWQIRTSLEKIRSASSKTILCSVVSA